MARLRGGLSLPEAGMLLRHRKPSPSAKMELTNTDVLRVLSAETLTSNHRGFRLRPDVDPTRRSFVVTVTPSGRGLYNTPEIAVKIWNEGFTLRRPASYRAKQKLARSRPPQP